MAASSPQISWNSTDLCFTQPHLTHQDFPPRDTQRPTSTEIKFLLFHPNINDAQHALGHADILKLARAPQGSLAPSPPYDAPKLLRSTGTANYKMHARYTVPLSLSSLYQHTSTSPPLEHPCAPLICATWISRGNMIPPGHTLQAYFPPPEHASFRHARMHTPTSNTGAPRPPTFPRQKTAQLQISPTWNLAHSSILLLGVKSWSPPHSSPSSHECTSRPIPVGLP